MKETKRIDGRTKKPLWLKFFVPWWFYNSDEPLPGPGYMPGHNIIIRVLAWYIRNPLVNFQDYVIGCTDQNYEIVGTAPVDVVDLADIGQLGWKWSVIKTVPPRPYVSYSGKRVLFHIGWEWYGRFQIKFNILNSNIQVV